MITEVKPIIGIKADVQYLDPWQQKLLHQAMDKLFKPTGWFTYKPSGLVDAWEEALIEIGDEFPDVSFSYIQ